MVFNENERNEELRKLRDELEGLKEELRRMTASREAEHPPAPREPFEVPIETSEESEEALEEAEEALEEEVEEILEEAEEAHEEAEEALEEEVEEEREEYDREDRHRRRRHDYDFGDRLGEYIGGFVEDVMEGVADEIEQSLFVSPRGKFVVNRVGKRRRPSKVDSSAAAQVMSALGNEHRLRVLDALSSGGLYASDLQEVLKDISPSTLSSHLDTLEDVGLIMQERRRGRYLITIPGRLAVKMAYQITQRLGDKPGDE